MKHETSKLALGAAIALTFSSAGIVNASGNPFMLEELAQGYTLLAEADREDMKPASGKGRLAQLEGDGINVLEGKCGEGRCGSVRMRQMMDGDRDGFVSKKEYHGWINKQAGSQFDRLDVNEDGVISANEMMQFRALK